VTSWPGMASHVPNFRVPPFGPEGRVRVGEALDAVSDDREELRFQIERVDKAFGRQGRPAQARSRSRAPRGEVRGALAEEPATSSCPQLVDVVRGASRTRLRHRSSKQTSVSVDEDRLALLTANQPSSARRYVWRTSIAHVTGRRTGREARVRRVKFTRARQFIEAVTAHDLNAAEEFLDPDVETVTPRGPLRGITACRQVLQKAGGDEQFALDYSEPQLEEIEGEVIARTHEIARWRETGEVAYERDFAVRLTLDDHRIVRIVVMPGGAMPSQVQGPD
jgi:hypothetical protein